MSKYDELEAHGYRMYHDIDLGSDGIISVYYRKDTSDELNVKIIEENGVHNNTRQGMQTLGDELVGRCIDRAWRHYKGE